MNVRKMLSLLVLFALVLTGCAQQQSESTSHPNVTSTLTPNPTQTSTPNLRVTPLETYLIEFGKVNVTAEVYSDGSHGGKNRLVAKLPEGRTIVNTTSCRGGCSNLTEGRIKRTIIDEIWMFRSDEKMAVELGIILECEKANGTACTQKANQFGRCIGEGRSPEECIRAINGSWKSEVSVSGYPLLQLQYKR
ncbi:MAG: hypothetical protein R6U44_03150 [Archaeoglobaceae archaeon]